MGCPCDNYECTATTTASTTTMTTTTTVASTATTEPDESRLAVIILNTADVSAKPAGMDQYGETGDIDFAYAPGTEVLGSCSLLHHGKHYVFGGYNDNRQISAVEGGSAVDGHCRLVHIGSLPFDFGQGACAQSGDRITLCFDFYHERTCWLSVDGSVAKFEEQPPSIYQHRRIRIADSGEFIVAIGSSGGPFNGQVDKYYPDEAVWRTGPDYPYHQSIGMAPVLYHSGAFYVIGGDTYGQSVSTIAKYHANNNSWSRAGELKTATRGHGAIFVDSHTLLVGGGEANANTELCRLSGNSSLFVTTIHPIYISKRRNCRMYKKRLSVKRLCFLS